MKVRTALLLLAVACLTQLGDTAPRRVEFLKPIPRIVSSRDELALKVRVEPNAENRLLIVAALDTGGEVVRRSDEDLPGADAPRTRWVRWRALPAGDLLVIAEVWDAEKPRGKASTPLCVRAPVDDLCPSLIAP